ncbi:MAG: hypothetical protein EBY54_05135, partial [Proteobacteria bacterium]|nr:hypothetical protein [Pseudomonadota bacterium]
MYFQINEKLPPIQFAKSIQDGMKLDPIKYNHVNAESFMLPCKPEVPIVEFRKECRSFAEKWIEIHKTQFKRLGVVGDWDNYYSTMSFNAEAQIVRELGKFLKEGSLYKGFKPVLWSTVEKTALADAEVEYQDHKSDTIYAAFTVKSSNLKELIGNDII